MYSLVSFLSYFFTSGFVGGNGSEKNQTFSKNKIYDGNKKIFLKGFDYNSLVERARVTSTKF